MNLDSQTRIAELESTIKSLKERLRSADPLNGGVVEFYIADLISGRLTTGLSPHDIVSPNGLFLEVKFSRLGCPHKTSESRRWSWGNPLGEGGAKVFDRLILVGEVDEKFRPRYRDPDSPYVIFDVPFEEVNDIKRTLPIIQITTSPDSGWSRTKKRLFSEFAITRAELVERYGVKNRITAEQIELDSSSI